MSKRGKRSFKDFNSGKSDNSFQQENHEEYNQPSKIILEPKSHNQKIYLNALRNNQIIICHGSPGTGKTLLSIGFALQNIICKNPTYEKLIIIRSQITNGGESEEIGFLAGSEEDKLRNSILPVRDNLKIFLSDGAIDLLIKRKQIETVHIGCLRGRSLNNCCICVEEGQNLSPSKILMILTRLGENSKLIISGDLNQSDLKSHEVNGLKDCIERLDGMDGVAICKMDHNDIVRNPLISSILYRYDQITVEEKDAGDDNYYNENKNQENNNF